MDRDRIRLEMAKMAQVDARFRIVHNFFTELVGADKPRYLVICRARMPHVAQSMVESFPPLKDSKIMAAMNNVHALNDEQVVKLSATLLEMVVNSVKDGLETVDTILGRKKT